MTVEFCRFIRLVRRHLPQRGPPDKRYYRTSGTSKSTKWFSPRLHYFVAAKATLPYSRLRPHYHTDPPPIDVGDLADMW